MLLFILSNCKNRTISMRAINKKMIKKMVFFVLTYLFCVSTFADCDSSCAVLDFNSDNFQDSSKDGKLVLRHMFGLRDEQLVKDLNQSVFGSSSISKKIDALDKELDIDGNGAIDALTDGLLLYRYLDGQRGQSLITGVISSDAPRKSFDQIETYLNKLAG